MILPLRLCVSAVLSLLLIAPAVLASPSESLRETTLSVVGAKRFAMGGVELAALSFIPDFYAARDYRPAWFQTAAGEQLQSAIEAAPTHGFTRADFHADRLQELAAEAAAGDARAITTYELVATDAAARLLHHLYLGKVDAEALDPDWNFERPVVPGDIAQTISDAVDQGAFTDLVARVAPDHPQYRAMQEALARYRAIAAADGWPEIPAGEVLKPGADDPRVPLLRQRLAVTGELADVPASSSASTLYDPELQRAVELTQLRHGLEPDGVLGPKTFRALNTPVDVRIDQLRLSLERARWLVNGLGDDYVIVNIAGPKTYVVRDGELVWSTRSITGLPYRKTPVFRDEIQYMEFNPTWTVPRSIFLKDKLPKIRRDRGYLSRGGYEVRDSNGRTLDPAAVNWAGTPSVTLVQRPGPKNALGQVKFMFPNKYAVYLHDTDDRSLFDRVERNLSSGCVRVEDPFVFADLLMKDDPTWTAQRREEILASGRTTRVNLPEPMPVLLTYWTAWVADGLVQFRDDPYERDARVLQALAQDFR